MLPLIFLFIYSLPNRLFTFLFPPTTAQSTSLSPSAELPVLYLSHFYQEFHFQLLRNSARAPLLPPCANEQASRQTNRQINKSEIM